MTAGHPRQDILSFLQDEPCHGRECLCRSDDGSLSPSPLHFVEVSDDPYHQQVAGNDWLRVYVALLPPEETTWIHRHTRDTLYVCLRSAELLNENFATTHDMRTAAQQHLHHAQAGETFYRLHASEGTVLVHRVRQVGVSLGAAASGPAAFIGVEFLAWPPARLQVDDAQVAAASLALLPEYDSVRARIWRTTSACASLRLPFPGVALDVGELPPALWQERDVNRLRDTLAARVHLFTPRNRLPSLDAQALVVECSHRR
ncbi:hypothetical protein CDCA_CDCA17G4320 [Cyanidium caldarium]|uniref:DUF985 domain-containing protein n=1 Tax=Cyanidium caldarium TaxID=2771 RepID=A0AAV9J129_CYACA|nr:hypothetical protein CDCA_CDCA17G4320 [Cyanidium caldarium]